MVTDRPQPPEPRPDAVPAPGLTRCASATGNPVPEWRLRRRPIACLPIFAAVVAAAVAGAAGTRAAAAAGDPVAGATIFLICRTCHEIGPDARNATGPVLNHVIGRKAGTYPGYDYSQANRRSGITWTVPVLERYLADPQKLVPGTKMAFSGLQDRRQIDNVIAYLQQLDADGQAKAK